MNRLQRSILGGAGLALLSCAVSMEQFKTTSPSQSIQRVRVKGGGGGGQSSDEVPRNQSPSTKANHNKWPPLSTFIDNETDEIVDDVQFLLDFAIIAHPKCATTFTKNWLRSHPDILMPPKELHSWQYSNGAADLVRNMYQLAPGSDSIRGYKAPRDLLRPDALAGLTKYFPQTKLIIGIRHPIHWFESFYNFRTRHDIEAIPPAELLADMPDSCQKGRDVCPDEARFHLQLSALGKTPLAPPEWDLLDPVNGQPEGLTSDEYPRLTNPVFLYEIRQLGDVNATRRAQYQADFEAFLELQSPLPELEMQAHPKTTGFPLDICKDTYKHLRDVLMERARPAAVWIADFFLMAPGVTVSSPDQVRALLETWKTDPCEDINDDSSSH